MSVLANLNPALRFLRVNIFVLSVFMILVAGPAVFRVQAAAPHHGNSAAPGDITDALVPANVLYSGRDAGWGEAAHTALLAETAENLLSPSMDGSGTESEIQAGRPPLAESGYLSAYRQVRQSLAGILLQIRETAASWEMTQSFLRYFFQLKGAYVLRVNSLEGMDPAWEPLLVRLLEDGFGSEIVAIFRRLGLTSYSPAYMAAKITELYGVGGIGINRENMPPPALPHGYEPPIADFTVGDCLAFLRRYEKELSEIKNQYGVPAEVILAVLLVETGLGTDLGQDSALRALASMAATISPELLASQGNSAQVKRIRPAALSATLKEKSDWAYRETASLIHYATSCEADARAIPGSLYGAIGICQFMPSNIAPYGVDGDKDGVVDLFSVVDAMHSVANYLASNGWRNAGNDAQRRSVIRTYNHDDYYAALVMYTSSHLRRAMQGKVSASSSPIAAPPVVAQNKSGAARTAGGNRIRIPESAKIKSLGSYQGILDQ